MNGDVKLARVLFTACIGAKLRGQYPDCMVLSARRAGDIQKPRARLLEFFQRDLVDAEIFVAWSEQKLRRNIFADFEVLEERADEAGTSFRIRGEPEIVNTLRTQLGINKGDTHVEAV